MSTLVCYLLCVVYILYCNYICWFFWSCSLIILIWFLSNAFSFFSSEDGLEEEISSPSFWELLDSFSTTSSDETTSTCPSPLFRLPCCWGTNCFLLFFCASLLVFRSWHLGDLEWKKTWPWHKNYKVWQKRICMNYFCRCDCLTTSQPVGSGRVFRWSV